MDLKLQLKLDSLLKDSIFLWTSRPTCVIMSAPSKIDFSSFLMITPKSLYKLSLNPK